MIQSYGLISPRMSRQEFEYAFTPLNPGNSSRSAKTRPKKVAGIEMIGAKPIDLFSLALEGELNPPNVQTSIGLMSKTEATLRGANWGGFSAVEVMQNIGNILLMFQAQSQKIGYEFMSAHSPATSAPKLGPNDSWVSTNDLETNSINNDYFQRGDTVLIEVTLNYPPRNLVEHRVVVVGKAKYILKDPLNNNYYLYPIDDPWYGSSLIMIPADTGNWARQNKILGLSVKDRSDGLLDYYGEKVHQIAVGSGHAYRHNQP